MPGNGVIRSYQLGGYILPLISEYKYWMVDKMITSTSSSQVKHIVNLQKKSKSRKEEKQFVVEGIKMVGYKC